MKWLGAIVALAFAALVGIGAWLLYTEPGLRWAASQARNASGGKLELEGVRGRLAGDIEASSIMFKDRKTAIELRDSVLRLELLSFLGGRVGVRYLQAKSLDIAIGEGTDGKADKPPQLPLGARVDSASIERITFTRGTDRYVIERFELRDFAVLATGSVAASAAFELSHDLYPVSARELKLGGSLERLDVAFDGRIADVPVKARAVLAPFAAHILSSLDAQSDPVDLQRLNRHWPHTSLGVTLSARQTATQLLAGTLTLRNAAAGPQDAGRIPITLLETRFATSDLRSVSVQGLKAALAPAGTLSGNGELAANGARFDLQAQELDLRALRSSLHPTRLSGSVRLATAQGKQTLQGTLRQDDMRIIAELVRDGDDVEIRSLRAEAHGGAASGSGRLRLGDPLRFQAKLWLEHFDPARFGRYPSGDINGTLEGEGKFGDTPSVDARWAIQESMLGGEPLESRGAGTFSRAGASRVVAQASFGGARLTARGNFGKPGDELGWALQVPRIDHFVGGIEGRLDASGSLTGTVQEPRGALVATAAGLTLPNGIVLKRAGVKASGTLARHGAELSALAEGMDLQARLRGGWDQGSGWSGELQALSNSGPYALELTTPAPLRVAPGRFEVGRLEAKLAAGRLVLDRLAWSDKTLVSRGEFRGLPSQWLVVASGLAERLRSSVLLDGSWDLAASPRLSGTASVRRASGELTLVNGGVLALGLERAEVEARFVDGRVIGNGVIASRYASATLKGEVTPEGGAPGLGITPASAIALDARVDAADLRAVVQPLIEGGRIEGRLAADLRARGTLGKPVLGGALRGDAIAFEMPPLGIFLRNGQLRATFEGDTLRVTEASIQGGEGRLTVSGTLPLRFADGGARLAWHAEKFGLLERPDMRLAVSGSGEVAIADKRVLLSGALRADRGYLELDQQRLPKLGDDVVVAGQEREAGAKPTRVPLGLDLRLDLGDDLQVRGYGLEGKLAGELQVETTKTGELRVYGRVRTVNATFLAYGQRLQVDPGLAIFDGPLDNPSLQMTAWRRNQQVEVGVQVSGNARAPRVQLVSQPPVPEGERLSWLVLGRAPSDASKADLGLLQAAAGALLSRGDKMPLDRRIARAFGLDEISFRGSGEVADRVVAVGKRLSDRLYISYEQGLGAAASALVKLDLSLTQRLAVRAETGTASGIGLFYRFSWD